MIKNRLPEICLAVCLISMLPLTTLQAFQLWERPHFQFFPLVWCAFAWFAWRGAGPIEPTQSLWRFRVGLVVWTIGLASCLLAVLLFSPWVASLASFLCIYGWGLQRLGNLPWSRWTAWQALLWCALPLPGNMDAELVGTLQWISSRSASSILDVIGVLHIQQGNVLEIRSRKLFVDQACSGVDSLYALGAVSIFITLLRQKAFLVALLSILTVPLWAWLGNVIRLLTITLLLEYAHVDFSSGWKHTLLGMVIFCLMAFCFFRALEAFSLLLLRFSTSAIPEANRQWHAIYNRLVCFPDAAPVIRTEQDRYFSDAPTASTANAFSKEATNLRKAAAVARAHESNWYLAALCIVVGLACGVASLMLILRNDEVQTGLVLPEYSEQQVSNAITQDALPERLLDATRGEYTSAHRSTDNFFGEHSRVWQYVDPQNQFMLSLDFPFRGFHALWICYTNTGKSIVAQTAAEHSVMSTDGPRSVKLHRVDLTDETGNASYLLFANFDRDGEAVRPNESSVKETIMTRLMRPSLVQYKLPPVSYQGQLYVDAANALSTTDKARYERIFLEALPHMMSAVKKLNQSVPNGK